LSKNIALLQIARFIANLMFSIHFLYGRADGSTRVETNFSKVAFFEIFVFFAK
jgi:hypothetical protein